MQSWWRWLTFVYRLVVLLVSTHTNRSDMCVLRACRSSCYVSMDKQPAAKSMYICMSLSTMLKSSHGLLPTRVRCNHSSKAMSKQLCLQIHACMHVTSSMLIVLSWLIARVTAIMVKKYVYLIWFVECFGCTVGLNLEKPIDTYMCVLHTGRSFKVMWLWAKRLAPKSMHVCHFKHA